MSKPKGAARKQPGDESVAHGRMRKPLAFKDLFFSASAVGESPLLITCKPAERVFTAGLERRTWGRRLRLHRSWNTFRQGSNQRQQCPHERHIDANIRGCVETCLGGYLQNLPKVEQHDGHR